MPPAVVASLARMPTTITLVTDKVDVDVDADKVAAMFKTQSDEPRLIQLTTTRGKRVYVNPQHIVSIEEKSTRGVAAFD